MLYTSGYCDASCQLHLSKKEHLFFERKVVEEQRCRPQTWHEMRDLLSAARGQTPGSGADVAECL